MTHKYQLLGTYSTPRFKFGDQVTCELRGEVTIKDLSNASIPWPRGQRPSGRRYALILYGDLVEAVKRESVAAVAHWWRVKPLTVWQWRKALDVGPINEGTSKLKSRSAIDSPLFQAAVARGRLKARDLQRRRKISEAKRGKPRPAHVIEAMRQGRMGKPQSEETRRKMREAHALRSRGPRVEWTPEQDTMLKEMTDAEVALRTCRSEAAVRSRRKKLKKEKYQTVHSGTEGATSGLGNPS